MKKLFENQMEEGLYVGILEPEMMVCYNKGESKEIIEELLISNIYQIGYTMIIVDNPSQKLVNYFSKMKYLLTHEKPIMCVSDYGKIKENYQIELNVPDDYYMDTFLHISLHNKNTGDYICERWYTYDLYPHLVSNDAIVFYDVMSF